MKKILAIFATIVVLAAFGGRVQAQCEGGTNCYLALEGHDSYGDGWNGGAITFTQNGTQVGMFSMTNGSELYDTIRVCTGNGPIVCTWTAGYYDYEVSFTITDSLGSVLYSCNGGPSSGDFATLAPCPTCPAPGALTVGNITSSMATVSWTELGSATTWHYCYGTYPNPTGAWQETSDPSATLTGLQANTQYYFFVYSECGASDTSVPVAVAFRTDCGLSTLPIFENFESNGTDIPFCWNILDTANYDNYGWVYTYPQVQTYYGYNNSAALALRGADGPASVMSPKMPVLANQVEVLFWVAGPEQVQVGYVTTNDPATAEFHLVGTAGPTEFDNYYYSYNWEQFSVGFDTVTTPDSIWVVFRVPMSLATDATMIDEITIRQLINCPVPSGLTETGTPADGQVSLGWTDPDGSQWQVAYGPAGFDPDTATTFVTVATTSATITGLDNQTDYDFYVRTLCGSVAGYWAQPVSARPNVYTVTADVVTIASCGVTITDDGGLYGNFSTGREQLIVLQPAEEGLTVRIQGMVDLSNGYDWEGERNIMRIFAGTDTTGMLLADYTNSYAGNVDITSEVGALTIWFKSANYDSYCDEGFQFFVSCEEQANCTTPYGLTVSNVTGNEADVSWQYNTALGEAAGFTLYITEAGADDASTYMVAGSERSFHLTGLTERTGYSVRLALECEGIDTIETTFATVCNVGGDIQVGEGTTTQSYLPTYIYYGNTLSQQLFTATELEGVNTIYGFKFYQTSSSLNDRLVDVYMDTTSLASYSSTADYVATSDSSRYFSGMLHFAQGWVEVTFDSAFTVPAGKNVVLTFNDHTNSYTSSTSNRITNTSESMAVYRYRDGNPFDPTDSSAVQSGTLCNYRNTIVFLTPCANTSCTPPNITLVSPETQSVTLNWTAGNDESSWRVEYRCADSNAWTTWLQTTAETACTVTGLAPATTYVFRVSSLCSDTTVGRVATATTLCADRTLPFFEGFENFVAPSSSAETEMCWYRGSNYQYTYSYYPYVTTYYASEGYRSLDLYSYHSYLVLPKMASPVNSLSVSFHAMYNYAYYGAPQVELGVCTDPENTSTFTVIKTFSIDADEGAWIEYYADLDTYTGPDGHLFIRNAEVSYNGADVYIDNLTVDTIPSCRRLASATLADISSSTISIAYTDEYVHDSYTIFWNLRDSLQDAIDSITVTTLTATITGLQGDTTYHVWVRGNCGGLHGTALYVGAFHTLCPALAIGNDDEYFNDFEVDGFDCLWQLSDANRKYWNVAVSEPYSGLTPYSGSRMAHFAQSTNCETMLILPTFDFTGLTVGNAELSFYQLIREYEEYDYTIDDYRLYPPSSLRIYYRAGESGPWTLVTAVDTTVLDSWKKYYVELPASQGAARYQVALKGRTNGNGFGVNIDDLKVKHVSTCRAPENVTVSSIGERTAVVRWTGTAPSYKVQYRPEYQWSWNARIVDDNDSVFISPLEMASNYEVRVIGLCSSYEQTEPSEVVRFTTEFCEDREERSNFTTATSGQPLSNPFGSPSYYYTYTEVIVDSATLAGISSVNGISFYVDSLVANPVYEQCQVYLGHTSQSALTSFQYDSSFVLVYEGSLSYSALGTHRVRLTTPFDWDGSRNMVVAVLSRNNSENATPCIHAHQATSNKVYSGFFNSSLTPDQANLLPAGNKVASNVVPDFTFYGCNPVCFEPVVSSVSTTAEEITVEWYNENATVELEIKESASSEWAVPVAVSDAHRYTFTGLASLTSYDIRLRRECDIEADLYSEYVELTVSTDTLCSTPEDLTVTAVTAHSATFSWTDGTVTGGKWQLHIWNDDLDLYRDVTSNPATVEGLIAGGTYHAAVRSYCCVNDHVLGYFSDAITFDNICDPVTNVSASVSGHNVTLTWTPGEHNSRYIVAYGYRDFEFNQQLGYVETTEPTATVENLDPNYTYAFRVRAICDDEWNSAWNGAEVTAHIVGIGEADGAAARFVLQPNPASARVTLVLSGTAPEAQVSIYGIDGRSVAQFPVQGDRLDVDLDGYAAGTYFVRVQTADWTSVRKLVVK